MSETSWKIYEALSQSYPNPMKTITLARMIGLVSDRNLRRTEEEPGLLEVAAKEIVAEYGVTVLTGTDGVKLTRKIDEVTHARNRLRAHARSENRHADVLDECLVVMSSATQGSLFGEGG